VLDNTIIIFTSDNGPYVIANQEHMPEEFHQVPVSSAYPLRAGKGTIYEGGTRVPLVIVWPGKVKPESQNEGLFQSTDFFPTFADMFGWKLPVDLRFDGVSQRKSLEENQPSRNEIFCHFPHGLKAKAYEGMPALTPENPASSIRIGDWKLIRFNCDNADLSDRHELYNLTADPGERKDLSSDQPERVKQLSTRLDELLKTTGAVIPTANPDYKSSSPPKKPKR
jgi:arylsulfatase A-like enzyme